MICGDWATTKWVYADLSIYFQYFNREYTDQYMRLIFSGFAGECH